MNVRGLRNCPLQMQIKAACAEVVDHSVFLQGLSLDVDAPQPGGVRQTDSRTKPTFLTYHSSADNSKRFKRCGLVSRFVPASLFPLDSPHGRSAV